jgi:hypothetical protein
MHQVSTVFIVKEFSKKKQLTITKLFNKEKKTKWTKETLKKKKPSHTWTILLEKKEKDNAYEIANKRIIQYILVKKK